MEPASRVKGTRVCILQSLPAAERPTGHELFKALLPDANVRPSALGVGYLEVADRANFETALADVAVWARGDDVDPVPHIECHGSEAGLVLANGDLVSWARLAELLTPINEAARGQLFVVLAACGTVPVVQRFLPMNRTPFWRMIVSGRVMLPSEVVAAFTALYTTLNDTHDAVAALKAMQEHTDGFGYLDGSMIMRDIFNSFATMSQDNYYLRKRARDAVDERIARGEIAPASRSLVIDSLMVGYRQNPVALFRGHAEAYFWLDRFPERREEFERDFAVITASVSPTSSEPN